MSHEFKSCFNYLEWILTNNRWPHSGFYSIKWTSPMIIECLDLLENVIFNLSDPYKMAPKASDTISQ